MDAKDVLAYWIRERENIRLAKESGLPKPWSDDPIFQQTYFCNVRREDDRVTRWIRGNWSPDKIGWDDYEYAMVLARFINWPDTLEHLVCEDGPCLPDEVFAVIEDIANNSRKVWGNAYVVTTHGLRISKAQYLCKNVLPAAYDLLGAGRWRQAYATGGCSLAQRYEDYMRLEGMGSFMSAQVLADLKNTLKHPLAHFTHDWWSWSAPGPGSLRGLAWFHGKERVNPGDYHTLINHVRDYLVQWHPDAAKSVMYSGDVNMQDLQNCLCEYDKYMRISHGTGRSKRSYPGR